MPPVQKRPYNFNNDLTTSTKQSLYNDLHETRACLEKLRAEQPRVAGHYEAWRNHRLLTIETVDSLQKKINDLCVSCNVARGVGAAAGIVGVLAWTVGTVLKWKGYKSAAELIQTSKYCAGASSVTLASSSLLEMGLTRRSMNEIERVIKKDIELTQPLEEWIRCSHKLDTLFNRLFQCNIASATFSNIMKVFDHFSEMIDAGILELDDLARGLQTCEMKDMGKFTSEITQKVFNFCQMVRKNPKFIAPLEDICTIFEENPIIFEFAILGSEIYGKVYQVINSGPMSVALTLAGVGCPDVGFGFTSVALNAVAITSHVVTLILAVKNIQEGKSKYSEALDEIKAALHSELKDVTKQMNYRVRRVDTEYVDILALRNLKLS